MKSRSLWKISVTTTAEAEDAVAALLSELFSTSASAYANLETRVTTVAAYSETRPAQFASKREALDDGLARIAKCGLNIGAGKVRAEKMRREDWANSWKRHFKPIVIGRSLLIKPGWIRRKPRPGQSVVILDPGLSFGTGNHATTAFCLHELARLRARNEPQSFLDIGTGSGILAIAAAKLGCAPVRAFDFDPESVRVANVNARRNRVANKLNIARADITKLPAKPAQRFDFVCANLISTLLIAERKKISALVKPGGVLALAGILENEFGEVQSAFEKLGLRLLRAKTEKEWRSGSFVRSTGSAGFQPAGSNTK